MTERDLVREAATERDRQRWLWEMGGVSVLIHPESTLIGKSLREAEFRTRYDLHVLGVRRGKEALADFKDETLHSADSLLVVGPWSRIQHQLDKLQVTGFFSIKHRFFRRNEIAAGTRSILKS